jgi:hypothetical protein
MAMILSKQAPSLLPEVNDHGSNQQQVSLALKLASIIENENRRVDGFIDRLIAANKDNSR